LSKLVGDAYHPVNGSIEKIYEGFTWPVADREGPVHVEEPDRGWTLYLSGIQDVVEPSSRPGYLASGDRRVRPGQLSEPKQLKVFVLKCTSCGANLKVSGDVGQFACGYCGTGLIVEHQGGIVMIRPLVAAITRVHLGTDRTAAELALARLKEELKELGGKRSIRIQNSDAAIAQSSNRTSLWLTFILVWFVFGLLGYAVLGLSVGVLVGLIVQGYVTSREDEQIRAALVTDLRPIDNNIAAIKEKMKGYRATVES